MCAVGVGQAADGGSAGVPGGVPRVLPASQPTLEISMLRIEGHLLMCLSERYRDQLDGSVVFSISEKVYDAHTRAHV